MACELKDLTLALASAQSACTSSSCQKSSFASAQRLLAISCELKDLTLALASEQSVCNLEVCSREVPSLANLCN